MNTNPYDIMPKVPAPLQRLRFFSRSLGVNGQLTEVLARYAPSFAARSQEMADFLYDLIDVIAQTKIVVEHKTSRERLQSNWRGWFERMWNEPGSDGFLASVWRSGAQHVAYGVDHRFISLAYSQVRRFCHRLIGEIVPDADRTMVADAVNRLLDLCILTETDAFLAERAQCNHEVMMGVAHQIRNPLTIIGGNAMRLRRKAGPDSPENDTYSAIVDEAKRLERMVKNVELYLSILRETPQFETLEAEALLRSALDKARNGHSDGPSGVTVEFALDPAHSRIEADHTMAESIFFHLLQNALEAVDPNDPRVVVSSYLDHEADQFLTIDIFNTGTPPPPETIPALFSPFHSTKPYGTGFGLPIASLAAHKNFGAVRMSPAPGRGTHVQAMLPLPGRIDVSGLFFH